MSSSYHTVRESVVSFCNAVQLCDVPLELRHEPWAEPLRTEGELYYA